MHTTIHQQVEQSAPTKATPAIIQKKSPHKAKQKPVQRQTKPPVQAKQTPLQRKSKPPVQAKQTPLQRKSNNTGLPDNIKSGVENLSGYSMDDVKVHYNSSKPAAIQAKAYAQGTDIHVGPGNEQHLPHEAWHVVQQKQGRVQPTVQAKGLPVNDDQGLEKEADVMGDKAVQMKCNPCTIGQSTTEANSTDLTNQPIQNKVIQGYFSATGSKGTYRVSDDKTVAVREGYPNHLLYAKPGKVATANSELQAVGSGIELEQTGGKEITVDSVTLKQVLPKNKQNATSGDNMDLWADCGESSGVVVGGTNRTALHKDAMTGKMSKTSATSPALMKAEIMQKLLSKWLTMSSTTETDKKEIQASLDKATLKKQEMNKALSDYHGTSDTTAKEAFLEVYWDKATEYGEIMMSCYNTRSEDKRDEIDKYLKINRYANPEVGQGYTMSSGGEDYSGVSTWNFHWGGVVMKSDDKTDNVTLENYAVGDPEVENKKWDFAMYGTSKKGQTFHEQHHDTKQHGKTPTTMVIKEK